MEAYHYIFLEKYNNLKTNSTMFKLKHCIYNLKNTKHTSYYG